MEGGIQFITSPILLYNNYAATLLANGLYYIGFISYFYYVFLGISCLNFLVKPQRILIYPTIIITIFMLILTLFNENLAQIVLSLYFGGSTKE